MPEGVKILHKRKAGAFAAGQLAAGEFGVNTAANRIEFSSDGTNVVAPVSGSVMLAGITAGTPQSSFPDNQQYFAIVTAANGFPRDGVLIGIRSGTTHTQRLQSHGSARIYNRYWINASSQWSAWALNLDSEDFTARGDLPVGDGANSYLMLPAGPTGGVLTADGAAGYGMRWGPAPAAPYTVEAFTNTSANTLYPNNARYWQVVTVASGFPADGILFGFRSDTSHVQNLQESGNGNLHSRRWDEAGLSWNAWTFDINARSFTAKGQSLFATGSNAVGVLSPGADSQSLIADPTQALGVRWAGRVTPLKKSADQAFSTTAYADITELAIPVAGGATVGFEFLIYWASAATTTGVAFAVGGPASPTMLHATVETATSATALALRQDNAYDQGAASASIDLANAVRLCRITGVITAGATGGSLVARCKSEVAGSAITVRKGSVALNY